MLTTKQQAASQSPMCTFDKRGGKGDAFGTVFFNFTQRDFNEASQAHSGFIAVSIIIDYFLGIRAATESKRQELDRERERQHNVENQS